MFFHTFPKVKPFLPPPPTTGHRVYSLRHGCSDVIHGRSFHARRFFVRVFYQSVSSGQFSPVIVNFPSSPQFIHTSVSLPSSHAFKGWTSCHGLHTSVNARTVFVESLCSTALGFLFIYFTAVKGRCPVIGEKFDSL